MQRRQQGSIDAFILGIPATVVILSVMALLSAAAA